MKEELIIGIDPGTRICGFGIIRVSGTILKAVDFGCIRPPNDLNLTQRYKILFQCVGNLLDKYHPAALSVETQYIDKNVQSGIKLGMARCAVMLAASLRDIPIYEYAPTRAKKAIVGRGSASKTQVQGMIQRLLMLSELPEPEDAADALALAICHAHVALKQEHPLFQI